MSSVQYVLFMIPDTIMIRTLTIQAVIKLFSEFVNDLFDGDLLDLFRFASEKLWKKRY